MEMNGGFLVTKIKQLGDRIFEKILSEKNIDAFNGAQGRILYVLWQEDGISIRSLSTKCGLAITSLTTMLERMENQGLISRVQSETDKRKTLLFLTEKAHALKGEYDSVSDEMGSIYYKGFSDAESLEGGYVAWLMDVMKEEMDKDQNNEKAKEVEQSLRKKFKKKIWSKFTKAINTYELVKPGDKIAVCISGGKDSMLMAKCFQELKVHNKFDFEVKFLVMDPGYSPENRKVIEDNAKKLNIPITIFESDIFESVFNVEKSPCYLCARMRRGHLYHFAKDMGCNKIALGHHYDDVIETILMGMLYSGQIQTMMPKLHSTNFEGMELIRPLYLVREDDIKAWRDYNDLHFIQCACKFTDTCTTCNNEENQSKRIEIKNLISELKKTNRFVEGNIFKSVENVNLNTIVAYKKDGVKHNFLDTYDEVSRKYIRENTISFQIEIYYSYNNRRRSVSLRLSKAFIQSTLSK